MFQSKVQVGTCVFLRKDGQYLIGQRKGSHAEGEWWIPGGKPDPGESPAEAVLRELKEETGLSGANIRTLNGWTYDCYPEWDRHFVCVYFLADWFHGEPTVVEPDKCSEWKWVSVEELPERYDWCKAELAVL